MREIKFRAWDGKNMLNIDHWTLSMIQEHIPENHVIEQFTGIKDKNGVEVYEGDVLSKTEGSENRTVKWGVGQWIIDGTVRHDQPLWTWEGACEIVGNIHENPELVKE